MQPFKAAKNFKDNFFLRNDFLKVCSHNIIFDCIITFFQSDVKEINVLLKLLEVRKKKRLKFFIDYLIDEISNNVLL